VPKYAAYLGNTSFTLAQCATDAAAFGSVRVMETAFATGHAAGLSAVFFAGGQSASGVDLRWGLLAQNAII
jgi:hypothetical protein